MGVAYTQDLRDRVLAAYDRGMKAKQIAELFEVRSSWARRVKQRRHETDETTEPQSIRTQRGQNPNLVKYNSVRPKPATHWSGSANPLGHAHRWH